MTDSSPSPSSTALPPIPCTSNEEENLKNVLNMLKSQGVGGNVLKDHEITKKRGKITEVKLWVGLP